MATCWQLQKYLGRAIATIRVDPHGDPGVLGGTVDPVVDMVTCTAGSRHGTRHIPGLHVNKGKMKACWHCEEVRS